MEVDSTLNSLLKKPFFLAKIKGDELKLTAIPPYSKFPFKVTVVAWQYGHSIKPKLKMAQPVERTFYIIN